MVGSFHVHPNVGIDPRDGLAWLPSASPQDWFNWGNEPIPHYVVESANIYRIGGGVQTNIGKTQDIIFR